MLRLAATICGHRLSIADQPWVYVRSVGVAVRRTAAEAADCASLRNRLGECAIVNPTDAAVICLTGSGMEGKKSKLASLAAEGIRRNSVWDYSELRGLGLRIQKSTLKSKVAYFLN